MELPADLRARLVELARAGEPNEVCGYLAGRRGEPPVATRAYPVENALGSPTAFALDGHSMLDAEQRIEADGYEVIAVFHSHPTAPATPSVRDLTDAMSYDPFGYLAHVIVSLAGGRAEVRCWSYRGEDPTEVDLISEASK